MRLHPGLSGKWDFGVRVELQRTGESRSQGKWNYTSLRKLGGRLN